jgi:hypothetical protein
LRIVTTLAHCPGVGVDSIAACADRRLQVADPPQEGGRTVTFGCCCFKHPECIPGPAQPIETRRSDEVLPLRRRTQPGLDSVDRPTHNRSVARQCPGIGGFPSADRVVESERDREGRPPIPNTKQ